MTASTLKTATSKMRRSTRHEAHEEATRLDGPLAMKAVWEWDVDSIYAFVFQERLVASIELGYTKATSIRSMKVLKQRLHRSLG